MQRSELACGGHLFWQIFLMGDGEAAETHGATPGFWLRFRRRQALAKLERKVLSYQQETERTTAAPQAKRVGTVEGTCAGRAWYEFSRSLQKGYFKTVTPNKVTHQRCQKESAANGLGDDRFLRSGSARRDATAARGDVSQVAGAQIKGMPCSCQPNTFIGFLRSLHVTFSDWAHGGEWFRRRARSSS